MSSFYLIIIVIGLFIDVIPENKIRSITYEGKSYKTTFDADAKYIGKYSGNKMGYLLLNDDGTGEYLYDIFGFAPATCQQGVITFEWGFVLDDDHQIIRFEREYGFSYPIIYKCTGSISFQGCSAPIFVDYILEYHNGDLHVSSSDDWVRVAE